MKNILSVDNSPTIRKLVRGAVSVLGHNFYEAESSAGAMDQLEKEKMDLVLLDWELPDKDGLTTLKEIKNHSNYKDVPVIMLTSVDDSKKIVEAVQSGAQNYVMKPFNQEEIMATIMEATGY